MRIETAVERGMPFRIEVDGQPALAYAGETIAAVLLANGKRILRRTQKRGEPRSVYCGVGVCYDCSVTVNSVPNQRACMTLVQPGLVVRTQRGLQEWAGSRR
jgi:aerobic-type carbon monoxide dehydrogenase small subunit (CoxS/CutS family)